MAGFLLLEHAFVVSGGVEKEQLYRSAVLSPPVCPHGPGREPFAVLLWMLSAQSLLRLLCGWVEVPNKSSEHLPLPLLKL